MGGFMKLFTLLMLIAIPVILYNIPDLALWSFIVYGTILSPILLIIWCVRREHAIDKLIENNNCNCNKHEGRN
jgi:hypothetical protein